MKTGGMTERVAHDLLWIFARTYRLEGGRFVNKLGEEASSQTLNLVADAQQVLA